ncbi:hypothetical protein EGY05_08225 [Chryseobacterium arthrosphaerae]|uniref:hypothetical protein n=1 Tax=Chryseobacterium arthrosphaerae TaxID=651561 RepID=UPI000F504F4D|nr:hypothetical protein [Chryseobacterium arthrosphaerae]AYZ11912.1 hypothetical protein EGY05_08225 [Chryseobacterium arthrosphaerae]
MSDTFFKDHPNVNEYFETSDGHKFYTENLAKNHAFSTKTLTDKSVTKVERPAETVTKESANDILAKVAEMDIDTAQEYLDNENAADKPRKTVVYALSKKIEELNQA